jgi:thiamine-monophosphate kinase
MGARPLAAFLSLALPRELTRTAAGRRWVEGFLAGIDAMGQRFAVPLAGGDTAEAPGEFVLADIVLVGSAPAGRALRRSGGTPGDLLYVTGALGGAAAELESMMRRAGTKRPTLSGKAGKDGAHPQLFPEPRLGVGQALLRRRLATAAIDLSDGLSTDLAHLCDESGVAVEIDAAALPLHALAAGPRALELALNGGEDYELLFSAPAATRVPRKIAGVPVTPIGRLLRAGAGVAKVTLVSAGGSRKPLQPAGWEHFTR